MGEESKENLDYYDIWTIAVWTILKYRGIWNIAVWTTMTNFQTLYSSISNFVGLFEPFDANLFIHLELPRSFQAILGPFIY